MQNKIIVTYIKLRRILTTMCVYILIVRNASLKKRIIYLISFYTRINLKVISSDIYVDACRRISKTRKSINIYDLYKAIY